MAQGLRENERTSQDGGTRRNTQENKKAAAMERLMTASTLGDRVTFLNGMHKQST